MCANTRLVPGSVQPLFVISGRDVGTPAVHAVEEVNADAVMLEAELDVGSAADDVGPELVLSVADPELDASCDTEADESDVVEDGEPEVAMDEDVSTFVLLDDEDVSKFVLLEDEVSGTGVTTPGPVGVVCVEVFGVVGVVLPAILLEVLSGVTVVLEAPSATELKPIGRPFEGSNASKAPSNRAKLNSMPSISSFRVESPTLKPYTLAPNGAVPKALRSMA